MKTVAAWVTHLGNGQILWQRFEGGSVQVEVYSDLKSPYRVLETHFTSDDWDDVVKVLTLKENHATPTV